MNNRIKNFIAVGFTGYLMLSMTVFAQNRGNNLAFQGIMGNEEVSAAALGMGGAFTSISGKLDALGYNPAGLNGIDKFQISVTGGNINRKWTENQEYNPNRMFVTLPFYLEHLYIPDPANNGMMDDDIFYSGLADTSYIVALPDTGLEAWSDEAADWINKKKSTGPTNISLAIPFQFAGKNFVFGASWNKKNDFFDFDRNETYLDPHIGYTEYNMPGVVNGTDSVQMNWYEFQRYRHGSLQEYKTALSVDASDLIKMGVSVTYIYGSTEDYQYLNKVGWFRLFNKNQFSFSYDTLNIGINGNSTFTGLKSDIGIQVLFERFTVGANLTLPYTINRKYSYDVVTADTASSSSVSLEFTDKFMVPVSYRVGFSINPTDKFIASLDYEINNYSQAEWEIANNDTTHRDWVDQKILKFGFQYMPNDLLVLRFGYRSIPQVWVPDGAAFRDRGPEAISWTAGFGLNFGAFGMVNVGYEYRLLKYKDQYYSNANYCKEITQDLKISYQYTF